MPVDRGSSHARRGVWGRHQQCDQGDRNGQPNPDPGDGTQRISEKRRLSHYPSLIANGW